MVALRVSITVSGLDSPLLGGTGATSTQVTFYQAWHASSGAHRYYYVDRGLLAIFTVHMLI